MPLVWSTRSIVQSSKPWLTDLSYVAKLRWTSGSILSLYASNMAVPDELSVSVQLSIFECACMWSLKRLSFLGHAESPTSILTPHPGCSGITALSLSPTCSIVLCFFATCYFEKKKGSSNVPFHFLLLERALICTNKICSVFLLWTLGHWGYRREKENTEW